MPKTTWIIAGVLTAGLIVALIAFSSYVKGTQLGLVKKELSEARAQLEKDEADLTSLKRKLMENLQRMEALEKEKAAAVQTRKSLEDEMRQALESKDVTISKLQGKLTVNILDRVLFNSGEAELKPDGEAVLKKVAGFLAEHPDLKVHVVGHTDNVPIRGGRGRFASNWELSTGRATSAVRFLAEKAGIDPSRLGALGYGEFRPVADNGSAEGRARNRRIAITILSEELAGADTVPTVVTNSVPMPATTDANMNTNAPVPEVTETNAAGGMSAGAEGAADTNAPESEVKQ
jgi:chemotaxis protein MotB